MRTPQEIFLAVGIPIPASSAPARTVDHWRGFTQADIAEIQAEAHMAGMKAGREAHNREWLMEKGMEP